MRLHALIFALAILGARAATIADKTDIAFEKELTDVKEVLNKDQTPAENVSSEQILIDQADTVKDVENNLRNRVKIDDIPVKVVVENVKPIKCDKDKENNEIISESEENIKRPEIDLQNPGLPEHQEHDTQNPEHFEDAQQPLGTIKQEVADTQGMISNGVFGFQQNLQNWWNNNQQVSHLQQNLQQLQESFQNQLNKLNETVQAYWTQASKPASEAEGTQNKLTVESGLKIIEDNIKAGVKTLHDGVEAISGKDDTASTIPQQPPTIPPFGSGIFAQYINYLSQQINYGFANVTNSIQNYFNNTQQNNSENNNGTAGNILITIGNNVQSILNPQGSNQPVAGTQSDVGVSPSRPTIWQNIQSIFQPGQPALSNTPAIQPTTPSRPIIQALQNNPLYQGAVSLGIVPPTKPASQTEPQKPVQPDTNQEGSNIVPTEIKPEKQQNVVASTQVLQGGPIKQLIDKNPIVQGITGAVQRLQDTIKPERPRDQVKNADNEEEKGGVVIVQGHKPASATLDNSSVSSSSGVTAETKPKGSKQDVEKPTIEDVKEIIAEVAQKTE